jgi:hypothetical protein
MKLTAFLQVVPGTRKRESRHNRQTTKTEQADKHTHKETTKITKENRGKNTNGNMQSVTT